MLYLLVLRVFNAPSPKCRHYIKYLEQNELINYN
nr:MAG TPA: hypothetical protein [Caudoviricetes sp.]